MVARKSILQVAGVISSCAAAGTLGFYFGRTKNTQPCLHTATNVNTPPTPEWDTSPDTRTTPVSLDIQNRLKALSDVIPWPDSITVPWPVVKAKTSLSPSNVSPSITSVPATPQAGELVKYGFPSVDNLRVFKGFILSYDKRTRNANWVLEHLTSEKVNKPDEGAADRSKLVFKEDQSFHKFHRATNGDFKGSGYDRGHLAAAANHRESDFAMAETFTLSNIAPQVGEGFNRSAWNNLEKYVRAVVRKSKNVYVCTGPLYLPRKEANGKLYVKYEVIGPNHVAVPTHFFKVLVIENSQGQLDLQSYVMPNESLPEVKVHSYLVPLELIERAAGLHFFPTVDRNNFRKINSKSIS